MDIPVNSKILISGGCSFTQVPYRYKNWPYFLANELNYYPFYTAVGASDNGVIANKVLHQVSQISDQVNLDNVLIGVMWSGISRSHVYVSKEPQWFSKFPSIYKNLHRCKIANGHHYYFIQSHIKNNEFVDMYYRDIYDDIGAIITSIKNILLIQNFCKLKNIKYFFSEYSHDTVTNSLLKNHPDVKYFYDMIDLDYFIPIKNMREWCLTSGLKYQVENDDHPTSEMSEQFTKTEIIPFLKNKGYI